MICTLNVSDTPETTSTRDVLSVSCQSFLYREIVFLMKTIVFNFKLKSKCLLHIMH